mgnify:CR=1 FL=1
MPNYQDGKIYKIISQHTNKCYVGSTTLKYLSSRLVQHRYNYEKNSGTTSKYILELGDYEIVLLESCPCNSKDELHVRERHYMDILDCVNKNKSRTKEEMKQYHSQYRLDNKDKIAIQKKNYKKLHKEAIAIQRKNYRDLNKDKIAEKNKIKITCDCGAEVRKSHILRHKKTKKHINFINN